MLTASRSLSSRSVGLPYFSGRQSHAPAKHVSRLFLVNYVAARYALGRADTVTVRSSAHDPRATASSPRVVAQPTGHTSFQIFSVVGDGACMFRAIVQGAQLAAKGNRYHTSISMATMQFATTLYGAAMHA